MGGGLMMGLSVAHRALLVFAASALTLLGAGCGGGQTPSTANEPNVDQAAEDGVAKDADGTGSVAIEETTPEESGLEDAPYLPELLLGGAESGPRPLLTWAAVDGTARYTLVVLDSDGAPYWAWSGTETTIHLGGFDDPDAIGPWVHEPMTWTVAATDADGKPLAISQAGVLTP